MKRPRQVLDDPNVSQEYVVQQATVPDAAQILEGSGVFLDDGTQVVLQNAEEIGENEYVMIVNGEENTIAPDELYNLIETGDGEYSVVLANSETQNATDIIEGIINEEPVIMTDENMIVTQDGTNEDQPEEIVVTIAEPPETVQLDQEVPAFSDPLPVTEEGITETVIEEETVSQDLTVQDVIIQEDGTRNIVLTDENGEYVVLVDEEDEEIEEEGEKGEMQIQVTTEDGDDYFLVVKDRSGEILEEEVKEQVAMETVETSSGMLYQGDGETCYYIMEGETVVQAEWINTLKPRQNGCHFASGILINFLEWKLLLWSKFDSNCSLRVQLKMNQHWFR